MAISLDAGLAFIPDMGIGSGLDNNVAHVSFPSNVIRTGIEAEGQAAGRLDEIIGRAGEDLLATQAIRGDGKGRHTTTRRELVQLPGGALVIDTPGMREFHLWLADTGLQDAFPEIESLALRCHFTGLVGDHPLAKPRH